jgi:hypothetical protein
MSAVISSTIWYPYGYPGSAYNLKTILHWSEGPGADEVSVRFEGLGTAPLVIFNADDFEAAMIGGPPVLLSAPVVTGTGYVGYTLTTTDGLWTSTPYPEFTYQWQRYTGGMWVDIGGATTNSYAVTLADEGVPLRCQVTATNINGVVVANSNEIEQWVPTDWPNIQYWFDAFNTASLTLVGANVAAWADRSGGPITPAQATASKQPLYDATGFDGYPWVLYDGIDDGLRYYDPSGIPTIGVSVPSVSFHAIGNVTNVSNAGIRSMHAYSTNAGTGQAVQAQAAFVGPATNAWVARGRRLSSDSLQTTPTDIAPFLGDQMVSAIYDADVAMSFYRVNGVQSEDVVFQTPGLFGPLLAKAVGFGSHTGANADYWDGSISEGFFYNIRPDTATLLKIDGYLGWRWRKTSLLASDNPYRTAAPTP